MLQIPPPPQPSLAVAFYCAPLVTPVLAIPLAGFLPGVYTTQLDMLIALPFVIIESLVFGYLGMLFICLPIFAALKFARQLDGLRLSAYTSVAGGAAWTGIVAFPEPPMNWPLASVFVVGAACSFGVSAFFCALGEIPMRAERSRPG